MAAGFPQRPRALHRPSEVENELWARYSSEPTPSARVELFDFYLPLARSVARRHVRAQALNAVPFDDLLQLACAGLLEAIDRFKPELGIPFRYFGARRISGNILNGVAQYSEINQQISFRKRVTRERVQSVQGVFSADLAFDEALDILGNIAAGLAIGLMLERSPATNGDAHDPAPNAYETMAWRQTITLIEREIDTLPERQATIVRLHYQNNMTFQQLGDLLGITKGRVSQLHSTAIALLRKRLLEAGQSDFRPEKDGST